VIRALWAGDTVTLRGQIKVEQARLYTRPTQAPLIFAPALTPATAAWAGQWADGLLTGGAPPDRLKEIIDAFRSGGGQGKPIRVQACHYYCYDEVVAEKIAHENWRVNILGPELQADLQSPAQFEAAAKFVRPDDMRQSVRISRDPQRHVAWLADDFAAGAEVVYVNHVGGDMEQFIDRWGADILPHIIPT
jgi:alkanesulfonate monooxygenase SsuD/methylene tetrahydromethanopterin reductase-like flavin-dependent oxidoreductase (luciferase family)